MTADPSNPPAAGAPPAPGSRGAALVGSGPLLVALGAAGWGAENLFRSRLSGLHLPPLGVVFVEHVVQVLLTLPLLAGHRGTLLAAPRSALRYVFLSGSIGSAAGAFFLTAAFGTGMNPTAIAVLLNLQPVVSTTAGALLFRERIPRAFLLWAALAILGGVGIALPDPRDPANADYAAAVLSGWSSSTGLLYTIATIACWGFATAAGRGAMKGLPLRLAAPLRLWAGLATAGAMILVRAALGEPHGGADLTGFLVPQAALYLGLLTTLTGVLPLLVYFKGLASTPTSLAGYCEMFYTVSATLVSWTLLGGTLVPHQAAAAAVLIAAVVMLNRLKVHEAA